MSPTAPDMSPASSLFGDPAAIRCERAVAELRAGRPVLLDWYADWCISCKVIEHEVLTAVALQSGVRRLQALSVSTVRFAPMTEAQIDAYVLTGEPMGKAGAYGIQGRAAAHIEQIRGSYSAIMGLPVYETAELLRELGWPL